MSPSLVIFDCDGVLVDSEPLANAVTAEWLTKIGLPTTPTQAVERYKGISMASIVAKAEAALGQPLPSDFVDTLQAETFRRLETSLDPVEGAEALVQYVQDKGYKSCIASSGGFDKMAVTLRKTSLERYFTGRIFSSSQVSKGKPAPDLFLFACKQMGGDPETTVVVEDSMAGVQAAKAAGMRVFAFGDFQAEEGVIPVSALEEIKTHL